MTSKNVKRNTGFPKAHEKAQRARHKGRERAHKSRASALVLCVSAWLDGLRNESFRLCCASALGTAGGRLSGDGQGNWADAAAHGGEP